MNTQDIAGLAFAALLNSLWQGAAIALLVWAALRFLPRLNLPINAATRCAVWWVVLAAVVILPVIPQPGTQIPAPAPVLYQEQPVPAPAAPVTAVSVPFESRPAPSHAMGPLQITAGAGLLVILAIWASFSLLRIAQIVRSYRYLRGIKQRSRAVSPEQLVNFDYWLLACSIDRSAQLLVSNEIASPMAVGFKRPAVIVPETLMSEFTGEELDHVILHELAHIARYDDWTNLFARFIGALLPIHPVAVWLLKRIEQEREIACDDWVVAMTGEARPYAASLTRLFELCSARRRQLLATGMADRASHLGERIEALLRSGREFAPRVSLARVALGVAILGGLVLAGAHAPHWIAFAQEPAFAQERAPEPVIAPAAPRAPRPAQAPAPARPPAPAIAPLSPVAPQVAEAQDPRELQAMLEDVANMRQEIERSVERLRDTQRQFEAQARILNQNHPEQQALQAQIQAQEQRLREREAEMRAYEAQVRAQEAQMRAQKQQEEQQQQQQQTQPARQGSSGSFLAALVAAGYGGIPVDDIIELRNHGVSADFLRALSQNGQEKLSTKEIITLADNGVRPDFFRALREAFPKITAREIVEAAQSGLNARDLRQAREFSPSLTLPQIIKLKQAGVL